MLFSLLQLSWAINIQKNEMILKTYFFCRYLDPILFWLSIGTSDRWVQQINRAMTTFYDFCNFDILGIVQFRFNSSTLLLHILSQSTCLNRLISIEYKNKWNILITSNVSCTSDRGTFWPILENQLSQSMLIFFPLKVLNVTRNFVAFFLYNYWKSFSTAPRSIEYTSDRFFNFITSL